MKLNKSEIKKILIISLSNIGDVILTFPVLDILKSQFPDAALSVVVGPKAVSLLEGNPNFFKVYAFNKRQPLKETLRWILQLRKEGFDLVVDLRNTAIPFLLSAKYKTSLGFRKEKKQHMKQKHLDRLHSVSGFFQALDKRFALHFTDEDKSYVEELLKNKLAEGQKFVVVGPGAANHNKRWHHDGFAKVCDELILEDGYKIVFVGDQTDQDIVTTIAGKMKHSLIDLSGKTSLTQLGFLISRCSFVFVNDSAIMHLASYLDKPVVALFGPTSPDQYGPWSSKSYFIRNNSHCAACRNPGGSLEHTCMAAIETQAVFNKIKNLFCSMLK